MFSKILDCPICEHRFSFDYKAGITKTITCPLCKESRSYSDFSALTLCPSCHKKLQVPLDIFENPDVSCPVCNAPLTTNDFVSEENNSILLDDSPKIVLHSKRRILKDGEIFDKYKVIRMLGKGGMAEVYLVEHLLLKQLCALKIMRSNIESDDPVFAKRFIREAKLLHELSHPNIVNVYDVGCDFKSSHLFIAMEYIDGKTLLELSKERQLSEQQLLEILEVMASALSALNERKIVHRDIKPSNIMVSSKGVYKLMDLGVAKTESDRQAGELTLTMDKSAIGTPSYASPEQCQSAHCVDIRSDIYSLGTTIYHLAAGKIPFDGGSTIEIILKVIQDEAEPLKNLRPDLSHEFIRLIEVMMKKKPDDRPENPEMLLGFIHGRKITVSDSFLHWQEEKMKLHLSSVVRAKKKLLILFSAVVCIMFAIIGWFALNLSKHESAKNINAAPPPPVSAQKTLPPAKVVTPSGEVNSPAALQKDDLQNFARKNSWYIDYDSALAQAKKLGKPVLIVVADTSSRAKLEELKKGFDTDSFKSFVKQKFVLLLLECSGKNQEFTNAQLADNIRKKRQLYPEELNAPSVMAVTPSGTLTSVMPDIQYQFVADYLEYIYSDVQEMHKLENSAVRNILVRLNICKLRHRFINAFPDSELKKQTLLFITRQIEALNEQLAIRNKVLSSAKKQAPNESTQNFRTVVEQYLDVNATNILHQNYDTGAGIAKMLDDVDVDPNVQVRCPQYGNRLLYLADVVKLGYLHPQNAFANALIRRNADINLTMLEEPPANTPVEFFFLGMEDIDTGSPPPAINMAAVLNNGITVGYEAMTIGTPYNYDTIKKLLLLAPDVNSIVDSNGSNLMHYAVRQDDAELAQLLLLSGFTGSCSVNKEQLSPWHMALHCGSIKMINFLQKNKFQTDVSAPAAARLKLWQALKQKKYDDLERLLDTEVDLYSPGISGLNVLQYACATNQNHLVDLLLKHNVDPDKYFKTNRKNTIEAPLQIAIAYGNVHMLEALLSHGADPAVQTNHEKLKDIAEFILITQKSNSVKMLDLLLKYRKNFDINQKLSGQSLLALACTKAYKKHHERIKMIRYLLDHGADPRSEYRGVPLNSSSSIRELLDEASEKQY